MCGRLLLASGSSESRASTASVEEHLNALDPAYRAELERIRALVTQLVPDTKETLSYGMPTLKYKNRALVYFTASKKHMSLRPTIQDRGRSNDPSDLRSHTDRVFRVRPLNGSGSPRPDAPRPPGDRMRRSGVSRPVGDFITYGVGVSAVKMLDTMAALGAHPAERSGRPKGTGSAAVRLSAGRSSSCAAIRSGTATG
jgi:hypothetical protein